MGDNGHVPIYRNIDYPRGLRRLWLVGIFAWFLFAIVFFEVEIEDWLYEGGIFAPFKVGLLLFWPVFAYPISRWIIKGFMGQAPTQSVMLQEGSGVDDQERLNNHEKNAAPSFRELIARRPAWTLVGGVVVVAAVAIGLMAATSPSEYEKGFGEALGFTLTSPFHAILGTVWTLLCASIFVPWQRFWIAYRATFLLELLIGATGMLGWALAAGADSEMVGAAFAVPLSLLGGAWVFGRFLQRSDGNPVGFLVGTKIVALEVVTIFVLLGFKALVLGMLLL